jgi:hypothetical protein
MMGGRGDGGTGRLLSGVMTRRARAGVAVTGFNLPVPPSPRPPVPTKGGAP